MEHFTDKQRQIIRLAFTSKDPELKRQAVQRLVQAGNYSQKFKEWANQQGDVFTHPETGNKVRFNSLPSRAQSEVHRRWEGGEYQDRGGPAAQGEGRDRPEDAQQGEGGQERGHRFKDRTELRSKPKKSMEEKATLTDEELEDMLPVSRLKEAQHGKHILDGVKGASYKDLDTLHQAVRFIAENPDADYSKNHWLTKHAGLSPEEIKKLHKGLSEKLVDARGRKYHQNVLEIANKNDLEAEQADDLRAFRLDKPPRGRKMDWPELFQKFKNHRLTSPETRERMKDMNVEDFKKMYLAILKDEDEEELDIGGEARQASEEIRLFEPPPEDAGEHDKMARLTSVGRRIVRIAYDSKDPQTRKQIVELLQVSQ